MTFEYSTNSRAGENDIGAYLRSLPNMKDPKLISECPLVYQNESPTPSSIIVTSVDTNKVGTSGEQLGISLKFGYNGFY